MQNQPQLEFLYEITAHLDVPLVIGENPHGNRQIVPVTGGTFEGPRLKGEVLPAVANGCWCDQMVLANSIRG